MSGGQLGAPRDEGYTARLMRKRTGMWMTTVYGTALLGVSTVFMGGCARALFPKNAPRTQYETYDRLRNAWVPAEEYDVFGNPQPALRARLSQRQ